MQQVEVMLAGVAAKAFPAVAQRVWIGANGPAVSQRNKFFSLYHDCFCKRRTPPTGGAQNAYGKYAGLSWPDKLPASVWGSHNVDRIFRTRENAIKVQLKPLIHILQNLDWSGLHVGKQYF